MSHNDISSSFNCRVLAIKQPAASPQLRTQTSAATTPDRSSNLDVSLSQIEIDRLEWDSSFQFLTHHYLPAPLIKFPNDEQITNYFSASTQMPFVARIKCFQVMITHNVCIPSNKSYKAIIINSWDTYVAHKFCKLCQVHYRIVGHVLTNADTIMNGLQSPWYSSTKNSISNLPKPVCDNMEIKEIKKKGQFSKGGLLVS